MRKNLGPLVILLTFFLTFIFWITTEPLHNVPVLRQYSQLLAAIMMICFAWVNFIATRNPALDTLFNGLDKAYPYHKALSIASVLLILVHKQMIDASKGGFRERRGTTLGQGHNGFRESGSVDASVAAGPPPFSGHGGGGEIFSGIANISMVLFILLILFALITWKMNYERWKSIHKLFFIPYIIGTFHYYGSSDYTVLGTDAFSIWLNIVNLIGISSAIYSVFLYEQTAFKYRYVVTNVRNIAKDTLEITGTALGMGIVYNPGQFTFLKVTEKGRHFPSHPFTISQSPKNGGIQFAIKALGDHTGDLQKNLQVGDTFSVTAAHGRFDYRTGGRRQIWLAGGIGITPFRSFYQSPIPAKYAIDFFYCYNDPSEGAYLDEITQLSSLEAGSPLKVHFHDFQEKGFLSAKEILPILRKDEMVDIYFCGPKPMRQKLLKEMKNSGIRIIHFHYENFQFK